MNRMRFNSEHGIVMVAVLAVLLIAPARGQETKSLLRWKNSGVLSGKLLGHSAIYGEMVIPTESI